MSLLNQRWRHDQTGALVSELRNYVDYKHDEGVSGRLWGYKPGSHASHATLTQTWTPRTHGLPQELSVIARPAALSPDAWAKHKLPTELETLKTSTGDFFRKRGLNEFQYLSGGLYSTSGILSGLEDPLVKQPPPKSELSGVPVTQVWTPGAHGLPDELSHLIKATPRSEIGTDNTWRSRRILPSELTSKAPKTYEKPIAYVMAQRKDAPVGFGLLSGQDKVYATGPKIKSGMGSVAAHPEKLIKPETDKLFPKSYDLLHSTQPLHHENRVGNVVNTIPNVDLGKVIEKQRQLYNVVGYDDKNMPVLGYSGPTSRPMQTLDERALLQRNYRTLIDQNSFGRTAQPFINAPQQVTFVGNVNRT